MSTLEQPRRYAALGEAKARKKCKVLVKWWMGIMWLEEECIRSCHSCLVGKAGVYSPLDDLPNRKKKFTYGG